jgi:AmiR/NasT family two-component response regulator
MLSLLQNEWDALMLELHSLKSQLETTRQVKRAGGVGVGTRSC